MRQLSLGWVQFGCLLLVCSLLYTGVHYNGQLDWTGLVSREGQDGRLGELDTQVTVFDPSKVKVMWARRRR